ncbi:MAG: hypothetical protein K9L70_11890 [Thiohalocapsa sp.]|jgi:hypothetical protein|nr:hypothetical protein [Thiohalocapsa sp.]MCF7992616.1 hypothetical protein [Thiohalocapsa sp.]
MLKSAVWLLAAVLLIGCQSNTNRPETRPVIKPETKPAVRPAIKPTPTAGVIRGACTDQAEKQRLKVISIGGFRKVTGSGGREIGTDTVMRVSRAGQTYQVLCSYSFGDGRARITSM